MYSAGEKPVELRFRHFRIVMDFGFPAMLALVFLQADSGFLCRILLVCLLHELAHGLVMCLTGAGIREVKFHASGMQMLADTGLFSTGQACIIYASGPLLNLIFAFLLWHRQPEIAWLHLGMGIFNLLPYRILDGGAILQHILESRPELSRVSDFFCAGLSVVIILCYIYFRLQNPGICLMAVYLAVSQFLS